MSKTKMDIIDYKDQKNELIEFLWEDLEEFIYKRCNKDTLNFDEYEEKYEVNLRKYLNVENIKICIDALNKTKEVTWVTKKCMWMY